MNRRRVLMGAAALGMAPWSGCGARAEGYWDVDVAFSGRVIVIGAGAAGLAAGYLLDRYAAEYTILEAGPRVGGRVQRIEGLVDVPIDLGAEWIHSDPGLLSRLIDDPSVDGRIDTVRYTPQTLGLSDGDRVDFVHAYYGEHKFKSTTWSEFLEDWILPASRNRIRLNTVVTAIDWSGGTVRVTLADGSVEVADRVIVTVPIGVLQRGSIAFTPALPDWKQAAIDTVEFTGGLKVFLRMGERFYPDVTVMSPLADPGSTDHLAIDGLYGKGLDQHLLTLFCVGPQAEAYVDLEDDAILELLVERLDRTYDGAASRHLVEGVVQNWSREPHIGGAYSYGWGDDYDGVLAALAAPVENQLFWAGSGTSAAFPAMVHGAMFSAYDAVRTLLESPG